MSQFDWGTPPVLSDIGKAIHDRGGPPPPAIDANAISDEPRRVGWRLIVGKSTSGEDVYIEAVLPPNAIRRFLRWLLLGERWVKS